MNRKERQAALDSISDADVDRIRQKVKGKKYKVFPEDILEAEFLMKFGFEGYWAIYPEKDRSEGIDLNEMVRLVMASRKVDAQNMLQDSLSAFIGAASAQQGKKAVSTFKTATRKLEKQTEADSQ